MDLPSPWRPMMVARQTSTAGIPMGKSASWKGWGDQVCMPKRLSTWLSPSLWTGLLCRWRDFHLQPPQCHCFPHHLRQMTRKCCAHGEKKTGGIGIRKKGIERGLSRWFQGWKWGRSTKGFKRRVGSCVEAGWWRTAKTVHLHHLVGLTHEQANRCFE